MDPWNLSKVTEQALEMNYDTHTYIELDSL